MVLYALLAILFIKVISHAKSKVTSSYTTVATSVAVFLGIPLGAAIVTHFVLRKLTSTSWYDKFFLKWAVPWSLIGLLFTVLAFFASRGHQAIHQIISCESSLR